MQQQCYKFSAVKVLSLEVREIVAQNNIKNGFAYSNELVVTYIVHDAVKIEQEITSYTRNTYHIHDTAFPLNKQCTHKSSDTGKQNKITTQAVTYKSIST